MTNMKIAESIVAEAAATILKKRPGVHGNTENSFQMIADLWTAYLHHVQHLQKERGIEFHLEPVHVAQMMVQMKQARSTYGAPENHDNFVDAVGYTALAGMLQLSAYEQARIEVGKAAVETEKEINRDPQV